MKSNAVLSEKCRVQKAMAEEAGHDVRRLMTMIETDAVAAARKYGLELRYAGIQGGELHHGDQKGALVVAEAAPEYGDGKAAPKRRK